MSDLMLNQFADTRLPVHRTARGFETAGLRVMLRTYLTRRTLTDLTPRELADIGVSRHEALAEAARLPWHTGPRRRRPLGLFERVQDWLERARTRRLIASMQARELRDIGVSPGDAQTEASKPFWRI